MDTVEASVVSLLRLLRQTTASPRDGLEAGLTEVVLRQQAGIAAFSSATRGIVGTSLNTLKRSANRELSGGFTELDEARRAALARIQTFEAVLAHEPNLRSKGALQARIEDLERENIGLNQDLWQISSAFDAAIRRARQLIAESKRSDLIARFKVEELELRARASLVQRHISLVRDANG